MDCPPQTLMFLATQFDNCCNHHNFFDTVDRWAEEENIAALMSVSFKFQKVASLLSIFLKPKVIVNEFFTLKLKRFQVFLQPFFLYLQPLIWFVLQPLIYVDSSENKKKRLHLLFFQFFLSQGYCKRNFLHCLNQRGLNVAWLKGVLSAQR